MKKTDLVRELVAQKEYKPALRIAKEFRLGVSEDQTAAMKRAYECLLYDRFYRQIGIDVPASIARGIAVLEDLFGRSQDA